MGDKSNILVGYEIKDKGDTIVVENLYPKKKKKENRLHGLLHIL